MTCRPLTAADHADARRLYQTLSTGATLPDPAASAIAFEQVITHPGTTVFGLDLADQIVSMATLHVMPNMTYGARPYGLIENVATLSDHQRKGHGRRVMESIAAYAWSRDIYKIMLLTGRTNGAKGFYTALGFDADEKHGMVLRAP